MEVYSLVRSLHVLGGAVGLLALFPATLSKKGSRLHRRAGQAFVAGMTVAGIAGLGMATTWVIDPAAFVTDPSAIERRRAFGSFLALIGLLTLASVRAGLAALERKNHPAPKLKPLDLALFGLLFVVALSTLRTSLPAQRWLPAAFSVLSLANAVRPIRFALRPLATKRSWLIEHLAAMGAAGIAAVTAFLVFGATRATGATLSGGLAWLVWLGPGAIGGVLITRASRRFATPATVSE